MGFIAFDLEGPLSPNDHAYELMALFSGGGQLFQVISRYDDLLTLENRPDYEPGDTLSLIVPFLLLHRIGEREMKRLAEGAGIVAGATEVIADLHSRGWQVCCITTTYQQYALSLTQRLGIPAQRVAATPFPVTELSSRFSPGELKGVAQVAEEVAPLRPEADDALIKERLDRFYWEELPATTLAPLLKAVKPVGGRRKVAALKRLAGIPLDQVAVVGDSITDFHMLAEVDAAGGLAVAFNANQYALPHATASLASTHISDLLPLLEVWEREGRRGAEAWVSRQQGKGHRGHFGWQPGKELDRVLPIHREIRRLVRASAALLG